MNNQKPTFAAGFRTPSGDGKQAIDMAASYGYKPDPWQATLIRQIFSNNVFQVGFSVPRQNGKNGIVEIIELYAPLILGQTVLHTAHQSATAIKQFERLCSHFYENPAFPDLSVCTNPTHGRGSEAFTFDNGARIDFFTRSSVRGRGFSADWLILDEAQEMSDDDWRSLGPTLTASPDARIILLGTPPVSSRTGQGEVFRRFRKKAYDGRLASNEVYAEWGVTDLDKDGVYDEDVWRRVNPAWDYRINKGVIIADMDAMDKEAFACEHLGYWYKGAKNTVYGEDMWRAGIVKSRPAAGDVERFAVGVVYSQDGESWAAAFGAVLKDGAQYCELIDLASMKKGTGQLLQIIAAFTKRDGFSGVLAHGKAGTLNLIGDAGVCGLFKPAIIEICRYAEKVASNALLDNLMKSDDGFTHADQEPLRASILSLDKYMTNGSGGGFAFVSRTGRLIAAEAAALALYWSKNKQPPKKRPKQKVW